MLINENTVDKIPPIRISRKDMKKFAELKRKNLKTKSKGGKLKVKQPTLNPSGELKMVFSKPIVVFGGGKMPDTESLVIALVKSDSYDSKRRLSAEDEEEGAGMSFKVTDFTEEGLKIDLDFSNPLAVSQKNQELDKIEISLAPDTFFAKDSYEAISGKLELNVEVPK